MFCSGERRMILRAPSGGPNPTAVRTDKRQSPSPPTPSGQGGGLRFDVCPRVACCSEKATIASRPRGHKMPHHLGRWEDQLVADVRLPSRVIDPVFLRCKIGRVHASPHSTPVGLTQVRRRNRSRRSAESRRCRAPAPLCRPCPVEKQRSPRASATRRRPARPSPPAHRGLKRALPRSAPVSSAVSKGLEAPLTSVEDRVEVALGPRPPETDKKAPRAPPCRGNPARPAPPFSSSPRCSKIRGPTFPEPRG